MIITRLNELARSCASRPFLVDSGHDVAGHDVAYTYRQLATIVNCFAERLSEHKIRRFGLLARDSVATIACWFAAEAAGATACLVNPDSDLAAIAELRERLDLDTWFDERAGNEALDHSITPADAVDLRVWWDDARAVAAAGFKAIEFSSTDTARYLILTTGTTGRPKAAVYRGADLLAQACAAASSSEPRWLLAYRLNHFAGVQVLMHVLASGSTLVLPAGRSAADIVWVVETQRVDSLSGTPTFWRMLLLNTPQDKARQLPLRQITIGGEAVDDLLLTRLARWFPQARVSQVFATTEIGSCFSVRDGEIGFPRSWLADDAKMSTDSSLQPLPKSLRIVDGQLHVRTRHGMSGYYGEPESPTGWRPTGDLVRIDGERVVFLGRVAEVINVGGVKVHPLEVEAVVRSVPGVADVRVYGRSNPITGSIVAAEVVATDEQQNKAELIVRVREHCAARLDRYQQPRVVTIVAELPQSNHKLLRRAESAPVDMIAKASVSTRA